MKFGSCAQDPERRHQVNVEHRLKLLVARLLNDVVPGVAGVVDDNVQASEGLDSLGDETLRQRRVGKVARYGVNPAARFANRVRRVIHRGSVEVVDGDGGP